MYNKIWDYADLPQDWKEKLAAALPAKQARGLGPAVRLYKLLKKQYEEIGEKLGEAFRQVRGGCVHPLGALRLGRRYQEDTYGNNGSNRYTLFCSTCTTYLMTGGDHGYNRAGMRWEEGVKLAFPKAVPRSGELELTKP